MALRPFVIPKAPKRGLLNIEQPSKRELREGYATKGYEPWSREIDVILKEGENLFIHKPKQFVDVRFLEVAEGKDALVSIMFPDVVFYNLHFDVSSIGTTSTERLGSCYSCDGPWKEFGNMPLNGVDTGQRIIVIAKAEKKMRFACILRGYCHN